MQKKPRAGDELRRLWKIGKEPLEANHKAKKAYVPLDDREDQSWKDKIEVLSHGQ